MRRSSHVLSLFVLIALATGCGQAAMAYRLKAFEKDFDERFQVVTTALPDARLEQPYEARIEVKGGTPPYAFELAQGDLPDGLRLDSTLGVISGKPAAPARALLVLRVRDRSNVPRGEILRSYALRVE